MNKFWCCARWDKDKIKLWEDVEKVENGNDESDLVSKKQLLAAVLDLKKQLSSMRDEMKDEMKDKLSKITKQVSSINDFLHQKKSQ